MKQKAKQPLPPGWTEKKIRAVIAHYDQQTDEEGAAEIESAAEAPGETWMAVPTELVGAVGKLIREHEKTPSRSRVNGTRKAERRKARR